MASRFSAVIFDMDGVLINSEPLWRKAMIQAFGEKNMVITEDECRQTMGMRIGEVIHRWFEHFGRSQEDAKALENRIITLLIHLINTVGAPIDGIPELMAFCKEKKLKTGLATSSSNELMNVVLSRLNLDESIHVAVSAENMKFAKPHPEVFLKCAEELGIAANLCLVIEDSLNGVIAAKAAGMTVIAVPDDEHLRADQLRAKQFVLADYQAGNMKDVLGLFKTMFP